MKTRIQQVLVVEGHHDTATLKKYYDCDTIETGGSHLGGEILDLIRRVQKVRGVIVFTDPDAPGNRIRNQINQAVPGCLNAFVEMKKARTARKVGVEHASKEALDEALGALVCFEKHPAGELSDSDLYTLGIAGRAFSARLREWLGGRYHIGMGTARAMKHRLNCLGVTKEELTKEVERWERTK